MVDLILKTNISGMNFLMNKYKIPISLVTVIDLELNQPSQKIIQIGAVKGNIHTGEIIDDLMCIINPHEQISEYITNLTGITQERIDQGITLEKGYEYLKELHKGSFINPVTWGGDDVKLIKEQLGKSYDGLFGRRYIDTKTLFVSMRMAKGEQIAGGLAASMRKVGLKFEGRKHDALDDAKNTFKIYCELLKYFKLS